jgi:hypothetical protein
MWRTWNLLTPLLLAMLAPLEAWPQTRFKPGGAGFRLRAEAITALDVNRVSCTVDNTGRVCFDAETGGDGWGAFWPRGTGNRHIYSSGIQLAGIISSADPDNPWSGHTTGAFFYNGLGRGGHGIGVGPIYDFSEPEDAVDWPAAARVPSGDPNEDLFHPLLRGRTAASQGDLWWLTWEGDPVPDGFRPHPLGVLLEVRGMGWNYPAGNEDVIYFIYTIYNITSTDPADYAGVRPAMREILLKQARDFHARNNAVLPAPLPSRGYAITDLYLAFAADFDEGDHGFNFTSVNVPFALGYMYDPTFSQPPDWQFDPAVFSSPFFPGSGFVGVKYLRSPVDSLGREVGLVLFGSTGGDFGDPGDTFQLYRYLSATLDPRQGDPLCNTGDPKVTRICFLEYAQPRDLRLFQSSGPAQLPPGQFATIAVAYLFAAPVATAECEGDCFITPGDPRVQGDPARMAAGMNAIEAIAGYQGFTDANGDGRVQQEEFRVVPRSLLGKALLAQTIFDQKFLLPFAPTPPQFFLVPGDGQVTVLWRPSATEVEGDPFFEIASAASVPPPGGGPPVPNPLYDPNFRSHDVEGYRIYRGRVNSPGSLKLLAQFDYAGTLISDYGGLVNPSIDCAPELAITTSCPGVYDPPVPGVERMAKVDHQLVGPIVQVKPGGRSPTADGRAIVFQADTLLVGAGSAFPPLDDSGVPFVYVDRSARSNLRYFYAVTAFDVNSLTSGPSSLESPRTATEVTPQAPAANFDNTASVTSTMLGRGITLDPGAPVPVLDRATGRFSGPFPPADDVELGLTELVKEVIDGAGSFSVKLDSLRLGSPARYFLTATTDGSTTRLEVPVSQDGGSEPSSGVAAFDAIPVAEHLALRYQGRGAYVLQARVRLGLQGNAYAGSWGLGCFEGAEGFEDPGTSGCEYNGSRWFDGPSPERNETRDHPQGTHPPIAEEPGPMAVLGNAGELTGVATIQMPRAYSTAEADYRRVERLLGGAQRAADFNVYWGSAGRIDSVIDATHQVAVPFDSLVMAGSWGLLNQEATNAVGGFDGRPEVLTAMDFTCVEPLRSDSAVQSSFRCGSATAYRLSRTAKPGPLAMWDQRTANARVAQPRPGAGIALYLAGNITLFELESGLPGPDAVWTLRTYIGAISGGRGAAGDRGPYVFSPRPRPFTAVGAELRVSYQVANRLLPPSRDDLSQVHTVPDPYYVMSRYEVSTVNKVLKFVNLPQRAIIRIYSSSGVLLKLLEHESSTHGGSIDWNLRTRNEHVVASGVYFYHIESGDARRVGRFTVVNFAQ